MGKEFIRGQQNDIILLPARARIRIKAAGSVGESSEVNLSLEEQSSHPLHPG